MAKVTCDELMVAFADDYPGYGFARNKGYRSTEHLEGLDRLDHRRYIAGLCHP